MTQPYIASQRFDLAFIIAPAFVVTAIVLAAAPWARTLSDFPVWLWVLLIVGVDVSHVYASIFRTYLDRDELRLRPRLYQLTPLLLWVAGVALYSLGSLVFWRALAYLAIFHFVRQQYGFMMIYGRDERGGKWLDKAAIYGATGVPLVWWLTHTRHFNWFVDSDIVSLDLPLAGEMAVALYAVILILYAIREVRQWRATHTVNLPKNLLLLGTVVSWGVGIMALDNDIAFTATNVVAHGVPYLALNWLYGRNQAAVQGGATSHVAPWLAALFRPAMIPVYVLILMGLAFCEEGLWDGLVWRDHSGIFAPFSALPIGDAALLVWLVPLLSLPQSTHYVLDAFIWRKDGNVPGFSRFLFGARHD